VKAYASMKNVFFNRGVVAQAYNHSYLGSRDIKRIEIQGQPGQKV
jgi:hypothetical protein